MGILQEFAPFKNRFGAYPWSPNPPNVSDNDVLYTAFAVMAVSDGGTPTEAMAFENELSLSMSAYLTNDCATKRTPENGSLDSGDNLIGWGVIAQKCEPSFADGILRFARKTGWIWPSDEGDGVSKRWLGRHRAVQAHLMLASKYEQPDFVDQFFWAVAVISSLFAKKTDGDAFNLSYCLVRVALDEETTPIGIRIIGLVWRLGQSMRGMTMRKNLEEVYGWAGSPHAKYIK